MITLGIDCGTQSTKVVALDWDTGEIPASASQSYGFVEGLSEGAMEQEPHWWVSAADQSVRRVIGILGERSDGIRAIGVSGQQHGLVAVGEGGEPIRPAKLWCDTSTARECEEITEALGGVTRVVDLVGNSIRTGYTAPKIRWLEKTEPENYARTRTFLLPHDYLNFWLSGEARMEYGDASGTALMDVVDRKWCEEACEATAGDLYAKLPPLGSSVQPVGTLKKSLATEWGLRHDVLVSAGGGDNMMAAIGTANVARGSVTASLGTSGTLFAFSEDPVVDPLGEIAGFCDSTDHWLPLVCTMNVTLVTEHFRKMFGMDFPAFDRAIEAAPAGAAGLTLLPYLVGERTPDLPRAKGAMAGIQLANFTPGNLIRAAVEAVTLGLAYGLERLRALGVPVTFIRLTGGGSNSAPWRQICADVFGVPVSGLDSDAGAALGAAIQAGWTHLNHHGTQTCLADCCDRLVKPDESQCAVPVASHVSVYRELLDRSMRLREALESAHFLG